jgi:AraC family transcriptional regulator, regulatory protein of adaptative response / DNA-3-methyladenine glycosylase II
MSKPQPKIKPVRRIEVTLSFRPPFDWQALLSFYQNHPIPGLERVTGNCFERVFRLNGTIGLLQVQPVPGKAQLKLTAMTETPRLLPEVVNRIRKMFDLDCDPTLIAGSFAELPLLSKLVQRFPGLRVPGGWDPYETGVCSILGQVVSATQRISLVRTLVRVYGEEVIHPLTREKVHLFPPPAVLATADLINVSTTLARKEAIRDFSRRVLSGAIFFSDTQDPMAFRKALLETNGLGTWSAEYISLRAIGDRDAFPGTDLILRRALLLHPDLDLRRIKPWRSYAAIYLWKEFAQKLSKQRARK